MALSGTVTVTTSGAAVLFSTGDATFRARSLYFCNLTAGNPLLLDITTTAGNSTGFTVPTGPLSFVDIGGVGFSVIASSARLLAAACRGSAGSDPARRRSR
jgi:hypothetical protein